MFLSVYVNQHSEVGSMHLTSIIVSWSFVPLNTCTLVCNFINGKFTN